MEVDIHAELALAHTLCDAADSITLPAFQSRSFSVDRKADRTEVTEIDRACEKALHDLVRRARPDHGFIGEEFGEDGDTSAGLIWVVDPIDGTTNFVRGVPVYGTLVALVNRWNGHDRAVLGVVSAPALGSRWWAAAGQGAWHNDNPIHVSDTAVLREAHVSITFNVGWEKLGLHHALSSLAENVDRARGFGDFWQHMLVAEGALDAAVDAIGVGFYDLAALQVIVEEAGGSFSDRHGESNLHSGSAISSNGRLHQLLLRTLEK